MSDPAAPASPMRCAGAPSSGMPNCHVLCASVVELRDGKIVRQVNVQAWDE